MKIYKCLKSKSRKLVFIHASLLTEIAYYKINGKNNNAIKKGVMHAFVQRTVYELYLPFITKDNKRILKNKNEVNIFSDEYFTIDVFSKPEYDFIDVIKTHDIRGGHLCAVLTEIIFLDGFCNHLTGD